MTQTQQFDFGQNWQDFSKNSLDSHTVQEAEKDFLKLFEGMVLNHKSFLDVGFGQGLGSLIALKHGANVTAVDINQKCKQALLKNKQDYFPQSDSSKLHIYLGSILDQQFIKSILNESDKFDIVHSWGVLHHTGEMYQAIQNTFQFVKNQGYFVLAIYNKHWTSPIWKIIKKMYYISPKWLKKVFISLFYPIIWFAKLLVTRERPTKMSRGMNFYYDVIDWVGGHPYEYASQQEMINFMKKHGFKCIKFIPAQVPTGCHQYIFQKTSESV